MYAYFWLLNHTSSFFTHFIDYNTSVSESQAFSPFDLSAIDTYKLDVDPDQFFFPSYNVSNVGSFYNVSQVNDLCASMPPDIFSTFHLNIRSLYSNYDNKFIHYLYLLKHDQKCGSIQCSLLCTVRENRSGGDVSLFIHEAHVERCKNTK